MVCSCKECVLQPGDTVNALLIVHWASMRQTTSALIAWTPNVGVVFVHPPLFARILMHIILDKHHTRCGAAGKTVEVCGSVVCSGETILLQCECR